MGRHEAPSRTRGRQGEGAPRLAVILTALLLAVMLAALDQTIVATALPRIASDLGGLSHISWMVTAYLLAVTASTPLWGKLGDLLGRKWVLVTCLGVFLLGSALCGTAQSFVALVLFRAVQGIGGGGLMVLAQSVIGDVVPPRRRGRYMGLFGAVFGVASVAGPLIGGFIVDNLSWRWVFYVNLPLAAVALVALVAALPRGGGRPTVRIDYAGIVLIALTAVCLVLVTSWGGNEYDWTSPQILLLLLAAAVCGTGWWLSARRAADPVLPLGLFSSPVVVIGGLVSFAVGFAMMGAMTYLPLFLQIVHGYTPTESGLHLLPMVAGMLICSIGSGQLVTRTGHYKIYPVAGTALVAVALYLLSTLRPETAYPVMSLYLFLMGCGLGLTMQVVVLAVQNAAAQRDLGAATSAATFFRSIGGSFGASAFGAVFAAQLSGNIADRLRGVPVPPGFDASGLESSPDALAQAPEAVRTAVLAAYSDSVDTVFLYAVPVALAAFVLSLFLRQVPLRTTIEPPDLGEAVAPVRAEGPDRGVLGAAERAVYRACGLRGAREMYARLADSAHLDLSPGACWVITHLAETGPLAPGELEGLSRGEVSPATGIRGELESAGLMEPAGEGEAWRLTAQGRDAARRLFDAQEEALRDLVRGFGPDADPELAAELHRLARSTLGDEEDAGLVEEEPGRRPL
ncbi:MFS transporter [Nocardiopsis sp. RSe5-2]|uniref:MFS transporter n=1 Tax=Nocardiopsis endophytica TaxID=3018445 RepID=A0ABT4U9Y3_9ACTN|nr:MFS transporter [Nocardiopsis endophytica]MDA2813775.1 MFS transporter [Nocardiopsis endophytica]